MRSQSFESSSGTLLAYRVALGKLYGAISRVARSDVVVDSTKDPLYALVVSGAPGVGLGVAHLVRDSRGVAHSLSKRNVTDPGKRGGVAMPVRRPAQTALRWVYNGLLFDMIAASGVPRSVLRYEDLVEDPPGVVVSAFEAVTGQKAGHRQVALKGSHHAIRGNPRRFESERRAIEVDAEWRTAMKRGDRWIVTAITGPMLFRFGYLRL
jgi:hypothetical protein